MFAVTRISIIIPAYNEELTIKETIADCHRNVPEAEIHVVDNNSKDDTQKIARATLAELDAPGSVLFERRQGKANAIRRAFHDIDADVYVVIDADMTYPASEIRKLIQPVIHDGVDMVVGDRHSGGNYRHENKRLFHDAGNKLVRFLVNFLFRAHLNDIMSGCRVFSRLFVKNYPIMCSGFELETEMTVHALDKRFSIVEIPIAYKDRPSGSVSKLNTFTDGARVIKTIFSIFKDYRPLLFFGFVSICFALLGLLVGAPVIMEYIKARYIFRVPSAILATGFCIFSLLSLSAAFILDTVVKINRSNYELNLIKRKSGARSS